jgi:hypothetical protein
VEFTPDEQKLVGWPAKRQSVMNPANTIFTIKRLIGRKFVSDATQADLGLLPYRVVPSATGGLWVEAGGRSYTPTEITAMMLAEVKRATQAYLGRELTQAVITVPAYFDEGQRRATKNAAEIAGIEIWHDGKIEVGGLWELEIERALANASAAVLLISANFMASTFIYENELPPILKRNAAAGLVIFPIFIGHCFYEHDPALSGLNAFNDPRRPLSAMTEAEAEAEFARFTGLLWKRLATEKTAPL